MRESNSRPPAPKAGIIPLDQSPTAIRQMEVKPKRFYKKVLPGLEPGLQGSKPWVLTNYTIEPLTMTHTKNNKKDFDTDEI